MDKRNYPHWSYPTHRAFKAVKRNHIRLLRKAFNELRSGCYYLPDCGPETTAIEEAIESLSKKCSAKEWGR